MPRRSTGHATSLKFRQQLLKDNAARLNAADPEMKGIDKEVDDFIASMPRGYVFPHDRSMLALYVMLRRWTIETGSKLAKGQNNDLMRETFTTFAIELDRFGKFLGLHKVRTSTGTIAKKLHGSSTAHELLDELEAETGQALAGDAKLNQPTAGGRREIMGLDLSGEE